VRNESDSDEGPRSDVDADHWGVVSALFCAALECDPAGRITLLAGAPLDVRQEVESLLAAHEGHGPIDRAAVQLRALRSTVLASRAHPSLGRVFTGGSGGGDDLPIAPRLTPGCCLGRYEIRAPLGAGGMGEVHRAYDPRLQREVAIKILHHQTQGRPGALARFLREARAASALNHPHIVTVHDIGEADFPYMVMELVEGRTLRDRLDGPLPLDLLLTWAAQITDGLVAAHERQMIHGDIKPDNILVSHQGVPKILDFGLAHFWIDDDARAATLVGTPGYLPPELISGDRTDQRSDQFALGATLYEMATGARAFAGPTLLDTLARTLYEEPPPLAQARPDLPAGFVRAVERCLRKDREERFPTTRALLDELRAAGRTAPAKSEMASPRRAGALPAQRTRLIGRQPDIQAIAAMILESQVRLLTLTGPGGTGKTRLGLAAAEHLAPHFRGGVFFVPLAALNDATLLTPALATTLGLVPAAGQSCLAAVIDQLRAAGAPTLLVLDNFEQIIEAGSTCGELLAACPALTVIVTSREVLRLYGEQVFPVVALDLPDLARLPPADELATCSAVALFVERARAVNPAFALTADNAAAVAAVCAGLDGLPLALELAAAQTRIYTPQSLQTRLARRLGLLTGGPRDMPGRQQTLRRTLDWSHQLLDAEEQAVFRRLAIFAGGFTAEAAQAIADPFGKLDRPVEVIVAALVDKSLLHATAPPETGEPRFAMLETLREYAREKLGDSGETDRTQLAHAGYFLILGEEGAHGLTQADEPRWLRHFETEHDNFRVALGWLTERDQAAWGLRLGLALFRFWERGEHVAEGRRHLIRLIALPGARALPAARARAMFAAGVMASDQGDVETGIDLHGECLQTYRELGDRWGLVVSLVALGNQCVARGDDARGDNARARVLLEESLQVWRELGDETGFARSLANLAFVARAQGSFAEGRRLCQQAAAIFERLGDPLSRAWILNHEGDVARAQNDLDAAAALHGEALDTFRSQEHDWGIASALADLGTIARQRGDHAAARQRYGEALTTFVRLDHRRGIARALECLALLSAQEDQPDRGLRLAASAASLRERVGGATTPTSRAELERNVAAMHARLGIGIAQTVWREGAALSTADAIDLASRPGAAQ
jgi:predicted ATPase